MEWHMWYLVSAVVSLVCVVCVIPVAISRAQTTRQMVINIIGLILTLPPMVLMVAAVMYMASK